MQIAKPTGARVSTPRAAHNTIDQQTQQRRSLQSAGIIYAAMALLLFLADIVLLQLNPGVYWVQVGTFRDEYYLEDVHPQEVAEDGTSYRWTRANSRLWLNQVGVGEHTIITLKLGGRPIPANVQMMLHDSPWFAFTAATQPRTLQVLLPDAGQQTWIDIQSETYEAPGDPRQLGIKFERFAISNLHGGIPFPPAVQYLAQLAVLLLTQLTVFRLGWRPRPQLVLLVGVALGLAALLSSELLLSMDFLPRLAGAGLVLAIFTMVVLPRIEYWACHPEHGFTKAQELRVLWALMLAAITIRLVGVLYPSFGGQDLGRNLSRFTTTIIGQLYIIAPSGEFAKGLTIYPTGPYLGLMPGMLAISDMPALMQGGLAFMDGLTALVIGLIALKLGGGKHAARLALALYAANIAAFGAMGYSFSAQIFGQWFTAPLALLLLASSAPPNRRTWLLAMILLSFAIFSHIGVALLALGWMGLLLIFTTIAYWRIPWWGWGLFTLTCIVSLAFLYVEIIGPTIAHAMTTVVPQSVGSGTFLKGYRILLINGLRLAYSDIGLMLAPLGLCLLAPSMPSVPSVPSVKDTHTWLQQRVVPITWLGVTLFFLIVDLVLDVQVRYFYFALPLMLPLIALPLGRIASRGRNGQLVAWSLALVVMLPQLTLWIAATWGEGKIPMTPLTH